MAPPRGRHWESRSNECMRRWVSIASAVFKFMEQIILFILQMPYVHVITRERHVLNNCKIVLMKDCTNAEALALPFTCMSQ